MSAVIRDGQKRLEEVRDCHSQLMQIRSMSELKSESGQSLVNIKYHHTARAILQYWLPNRFQYLSQPITNLLEVVDGIAVGGL